MIILPEKIDLTAMNEHWKVNYIDAPIKPMLIEHAHGELALYGQKYTKRKARQLIIRWIKLKTYQHMTEQLKKLNRRVKGKYDKVVIKSHSSQWGSYSCSGTISLDYKLIFLPPTLVKHLLLHELCHSYTMYHNDKFWKTLAKFDKHWEEHKAALYDAEDHIPEWAE